jgi:hypothetical protein
METRSMRKYENCQTIAQDWASSQPIEDLLRKQRKGEFLTHDEKKRITREAEFKRKQRQNN